jgi:hypothetical protein
MPVNYLNNSTPVPQILNFKASKNHLTRFVELRDGAGLSLNEFLPLQYSKRPVYNCLKIENLMGKKEKEINNLVKLSMKKGLLEGD